MKKIVYIGGGGGSKNILPGLKNDFDVTAVVTTFDNGGSYGRIRYQYKTVLTGDVRDALVSLADNEELAQAWSWRFNQGDFKGHTLGNIFLANFYNNLKNYNKTLDLAHKIMKAKGKVLPVSYDWAELCAELEDGTVIEGETNIDEVRQPPDEVKPGTERSKIRKVYLTQPAEVNPEVADAIAEADLIILGPGDLYTSIIPNLLSEGVTEAIKNSKAKKAYFVNVFTTRGQTDSLTAFDHSVEIENYLGCSLDYVVINDSKASSQILEHYQERNEKPVEIDLERLKNQNYQVFEADLLSEEFIKKPESDILKRSVIVNDPNKVLKLIKSII